MWMVTVGLAVCIIESFTLLKLGIDIGFAASQIRFGSFLYATMLILYFLSTAKKAGGNDFLKYVGDRSYGIYYIHCFTLLFANKICRLIGFDKFWITNFIGCFVIALLGSMLALEIVRWGTRKLRIEKYLRWIGFD